MNGFVAVCVLVVIVGFATFTAGRQEGRMNVAQECRDLGRFSENNLSYACDNDMVIVDGESRLIAK